METGLKTDAELVRIVDAASAEAARRAGAWLKCRPGCTQCCIGVFAIDQLDAQRLRDGLRELDATDAGRAAAVRLRAEQSRLRLAPRFPGDPRTGRIEENGGQNGGDRFEDFANDEPCPVLDPLTGTCDLYASRPMTCRVFGPPIRSEEGLGVCELCFDGATGEEILAAELNMEWSPMEEALNAEAEEAGGGRGKTIVAFALAGA